MKKTANLLLIFVLVVSFAYGAGSNKAAVRASTDDPHFLQLQKAFETDDFFIESFIEYPAGSGKYGIRAASRIARNYQTGKPKIALYLEGKAYDMGYQMGYLAEFEVAEMTNVFVKLIPADFIDPTLPLKERLKIGTIINKVMLPGVKNLSESPDIPQEYKDQVRGILKGCQAVNPDTLVNKNGLGLLNYGMDVLFSIVYEGSLLEKEGVMPDQLRIPMMCNAFSIKGIRSGADYHYFGRDFQFDCGGVFQNTACLVIYNPESSFNQVPALPSVVQSAPGMVGAITAMNKNGVAMGVDMVPAHACTPQRPGLDSLFMVRHCIQYGAEANAVVSRVKEAYHGVPWLYPFADGSTGKAAVIETIQSLDYKSTDDLALYLYNTAIQKPRSKFLNKYLDNYLDNLAKTLPDPTYIKNYMQQFDNLKTGIFVRWSDYQYPADYLNYNPALWNLYNDSVLRMVFGEKYLHDDAMSETGSIDRVTLNQQDKLEYEKNCPLNYYFPPQRETRNDLVLVSNIFTSPELRYTSLNYWTALLVEASQYTDDLQWRYDTLNYLIYLALKKGGESIDKATARCLIDFLNPETGPFPGYYANIPKSRDGKTFRIDGSTTLCDLKAKTFESHFGYYADLWVTVTLPNYFEPQK